MEPAKWFDVMCCRACLATDCKLYNMHEHNLVEEFVRVTGFDVGESDQFPQHICVLCTSLLQRCASFRAKCLRAALCLMPHLKNGNLTTDSVRNVDRIANKFVDLAVNELEVMDSLNIPNSLQQENKDIVKTDLDIEIEREIKQETETNILEDNGILENVKNETREETFIVHYLIDFTENDNFECASNIDLSVSHMSTDNIQKTAKTETIEVCSIKKSEMTKADNSVSKKEISIKTKLEKPVVSVQRKRKKKKSHFRTAENNFMPVVDLEKFEQTYNVKITTLTQTEQLAIIESQRASAQYRAAPFRCQPCGKHFRIEEMYKRHMASHAKEAGKYECPTCTLRFKLSSKCRIHHDQHRFKIVCRECGFISRLRHQAKKHHEFHVGKTYTCEYCGKVFSKPASYFTHVRLQHPTMNRVCNICGETFVNDDGLTMHKSKMHRVPKNDKHRECKMCSVTFSSLDALEKHRDTAGDHADLKPCIQCGGNFDSGDKLQEHVKAEHPHCEKCNLTFINAGSFDIHYRRKHLGRGRPDDKAKEANRRARERGLPLPYPPYPHKKNEITAADKTSVCCEKCGKLYRSQCFLRYHQCSSRQTEKIFECNECQKTFSFKCNLLTHLRTHSGERPFQCPQCPRAFTGKGNLERHRKVMHLNVRAHYKCPICASLLCTPSAVRVHVKEVHHGHRPERNRKRRQENNLQASSCVDSI